MSAQASQSDDGEVVPHATFPFCFTGFRKVILRTTSPSPSVTPLLVGEALAFRQLRSFAD